MTEQTALPPLLAAACALELDRDAASGGESNDYQRGMTRAVELLRLLNEEEPAVPAPATARNTPSRRAGLRDEISAALEAADYRMDMRRGDLADAVLPVLYREWPWLRAEAEDAATDRDQLRQRIAEALIEWSYRGKNPEHGGILETVRANAYSRADAVLAVLPTVDPAAVDAVRALHQPISRAGFLVCAHCSGWNGVRCLGLVRDYPCDTIAALDGKQAGEAQQDERCARCTHPKRDHDGRADHRAKYSPRVAGEPWCHACNAECDYTSEAQQDPTQDGEAAALLATPCDACDHTLNWHRNDVGCTVPRCICGRWQQPAVARPGQPETEA